MGQAVVLGRWPVSTFGTSDGSLVGSRYCEWCLLPRLDDV